MLSSNSYDNVVYGLWKDNNIIDMAVSNLYTDQTQATTTHPINSESHTASPDTILYAAPCPDLQQPPSLSQQIIGHKRTMAYRSPQPDHQGRSRHYAMSSVGSSSTETSLSNLFTRPSSSRHQMICVTFD
ncbi:predicted protein [Lichtheimia corymbifera JMRC:FSU:9682]|uniref:Uncharacterized protein n=1 Tax=Lichtheimia corymbifera JMRC:FSU:9682 TaxID=1263082 RepID=A0A068SH14_9FUNG|nr:predicted protein [Lichtheimia corymbifera JMRC:FSU:9682]